MREKELQNIKAYREIGEEYRIRKQVEEEEPKEVQSNKPIKNTKVEEKKEDETPPFFIYANEEFIDDCKNLVKTICITEEGEIAGDLDILLVLNAGGQYRLHHINYRGEEEEVQCIAIGSGAIHVQEFLDKNYSFDKNVNQLLDLAHFCILYVQKMGLDNFVGIEEDLSKLPDNRVILVGNDGEVGTGILNPLEKEKPLKKIMEKIDSFVKLKNSISSLLE